MTYPQPEDWPTDEHINRIGQEGATGEHCILKSLSVGDNFILNRTGFKYKLTVIGKTNSSVSTNRKVSLMNNQSVVTKI
jgi:hypothetical protein